MPNLHDLFEAATDGLPPLPDLAPPARRIVRRRKLAARTTAAVLSSALVIGVGTFALSAQHTGQTTNAAGGSPHPFSRQYLAATLQQLWPNPSQHLSLDGPNLDVTQDGDVIGQLSFTLSFDGGQFPKELTCPALGPAPTCVEGTSSDGDQAVSAERTLLTETPTPSTTAGWMSEYGNRVFRQHGSYFARLSFVRTGGSPISAQPLLDMALSSAYEQFVESAIASGPVYWLRPPTGSPVPVASQPASATVTAEATSPTGSVPASPSATPTGSASAPDQSPTPSPVTTPTASASATNQPPTASPTAARN